MLATEVAIAYQVGLKKKVHQVGLREEKIAIVVKIDPLNHRC